MAQNSYDSLDDIALIEYVRGGDVKAWEFIFKKHYVALLNYVSGKYWDSLDREAAEDLTNEVFAKFWEKRETLEIRSSVKGYLYMMARNHTLNYLKREAYIRDYNNNEGKTKEWHKNETEDAYHFSELEKKLYEAIDDLPEERKEIFRLSRFEDLTYKEIAETLGVSARNVHYQIGLALKELREKLKGYADPQYLKAVALWGAALTATLLSDIFFDSWSS
ncbi:RNA polymerase sigma-70 factor [Algivirga pacifica]|uniref:RNA polymerase sigma-70 factor n=1 Tax=Algivirga pacifica TaxID=1162670 RepID=A0ABP9D4Q7_9BACT